MKTWYIHKSPTLIIKSYYGIVCCMLFVTSSETTFPTPRAVDCYRSIQVHGTMHKLQIERLKLYFSLPFCFNFTIQRVPGFADPCSIHCTPTGINLMSLQLGRNLTNHLIGSHFIIKMPSFLQNASAHQCVTLHWVQMLKTSLSEWTREDGG